MGNHNCIIFARAGIKRVHTPLRGNEELALHAVTSHCWNGEEPPRGLDPQGEHGINTARTLYSGWKLNKNPPVLAGHVEGWELGQSLREAAPCARGEGRAQNRGRCGSSGSILCLGGCVQMREGRVGRVGIKVTLSQHTAATSPFRRYCPVRGESNAP